MKKLHYGIEDEDGDVPGNVFEEGEMISSVLIPSNALSDREKPGELQIKEDMKDNPLKQASKIDPSEYLVKRWDDGKAKRIYSGMMGSLEDRWKDIDFIEVYGDGEIYADEEKIKGDFTITYGSAVLIRDVQDIAERTDQEMEREYFYCMNCDREVKSYKAIENAMPDDWVIDSDDKTNHIERRDDGSIVLKGICPECAEKETHPER